MEIKIASCKDIERIAQLANIMWHGSSLEDLESGFKKDIDNKDTIVFIVEEKEKIVGFAQCGLRYDYVEGTNSSPVAYLEGIFIEEDYRKKGYAKELVNHCEKWSKDKGCLELASDCELANEGSLKFHMSIDFIETNRIICFKKDL